MNLKEKPLFLLLLPMFFCLHGLNQYIDAISIGEIAWIYVKIVIGILLFFSASYLFLRKVHVAALFTIFTGTWYLFFGDIKHFIFKHIYPIKYILILPGLLFVSVLAIIFFKKIVKYQKIYLYLNLLLPILCVVDIANLITQSFSKPKETNSEILINKSKVIDRPNFYFLLFDEYAGRESMHNKFNFDNQAFYDMMKKHGFIEWNSNSNYNHTTFSLASIVNQSYIQNIDFSKYIEDKHLVQGTSMTKNAQVADAFTSLGYNINSFSLFDVKNHHNIEDAPFALLHETLLTNKIFHNKAFSDIGGFFLKGKFKVKFIQEWFIKPYRDYNPKVEKLLYNVLEQNESDPKFVYAHFLMPHPAYSCDSLGKATPVEDQLIPANKNMYISYLKYTNKKIEKFVSDIEKKDSNAICLILSDHGFRYDSKGKRDTLDFDNICLIRDKSGKIPTPTTKISTVNIFRYILNNRFGQNLPYLKDTSIFVTEIPPL